jgi:hypothetical protein
MTNKPAKSMQLVLTRDSGVGSIKVDMEAFFDFSFWMAEELEDLIQRHRHRYGLPARASGSRRSHRTRSEQK